MRIGIIGGGFAGVKAALSLGNVENADVTLISDRPNFEYHAALYRSATGKSPREVVLPIKDLIAPYDNIAFVQEEVMAISPQKKQVTTQTGGQRNFDMLIIAIGRQANYFGIAGLPDHAEELDTITNTIALRAKLRRLFDDAEDITQLQITVIGAGPSGVELAAEIKHFVQILRPGMPNPPCPQVRLIEAGKRVLPNLHEKTSRAAEKRLRALGVEVMNETMVTAVTENEVHITGEVLHSDCTIWTAGAKTNEVVSKKMSGATYSKRGLVEVDEYLQMARDVYVIGDNAETEFSGMAQTALHDGQFVAADIERQLKHQARKPYVPHQPYYVLPIGANYAVFESKHIRLSGWLAWAIRRFADFRIFRNFEPFKAAVKTWRKGNTRARGY